MKNYFQINEKDREVSEVPPQDQEQIRLCELLLTFSSELSTLSPAMRPPMSKQPSRNQSIISEH